MTTTIEDRCTDARGAESIFARVLADVLRFDRVSLDCHFFDHLGADSLDQQVQKRVKVQ